MNKAPKPFDCSYSPQFAELLHNLGISLIIRTYETEKVIILSSVERDKIIQSSVTSDNLAKMPYSPCIYNGELYVLNSTYGELIRINIKTKEYDKVCNVGGFAQGMTRYENYLFIGVSKLKQKLDNFKDLPVVEKPFTGIVAVHLPSGNIIGKLQYNIKTDEIYDINILENTKIPTLSKDTGIYKSPVYSSEKRIKKFFLKPNKELKFEIIQNTTSQELLNRFQHLIFPPLVKKLKKNIIKGTLIPFVAYFDKSLAAMAVAEIRPDKTAELHSVFVTENFRNKGLAGELLNIIDKVLIQNSIKYVDVVYSDTYEGIDITEKLLLKNGYLQPKRTVQNIILNIENVLKAEWIKNSVKNEENIQIINFSELSQEDKKEILISEKQKKFPAYLRPFQMPEFINPKISKFAKYNNKIAGWCILHNVNSETLQCSALFVFDEYKEKFISKKLMAKAFSDMKNIKYTTYQLQNDDKFIVNYLNSLFAENNAIKKTFYTIAARKYYNNIIN
ncbi:MAG: GNAT family N-acetyltransferase [Bacteroidales bacterium]|nr:GNAT family N-acetyltransferase [Bacteroidales bacterium]